MSHSLKKEKISVTTYVNLISLFKEKEWIINEKSEFSTFERYYRILEMLDDEQKEFLINLSYKFLHIPISKYLENLIPIIKKILCDFPKEKLYFTCCLPESKQGKIKSSTMVLYQLKGTTIKQEVDFRRCHVIENIADLTKIKSFENKIIILIDDFIGTGGTAKEALEYVRQQIPQFKDNSQIIVASIVAQEMGVKCLEELGVKTYYNHIVKKGISDEFDGKELSDAVLCMEGIEDKLKGLKTLFRFGYKRSEALVCMERCPNNTFPIYWFKKNDSPYER